LTRWGAVWAVFGGGLAAAAYIGKVPPALPALRGDLGLTLVESGFIATMFNAMGMLVGIFAGMLCDRFGHKRLALAGLATLSLGGLLGALAGGFAALLAARFLEGVGFILFTVSAPALMVAAVSSADRARALGLWSAYMPSGGSLALLAAPLVIGAWGWRELWLGSALGAAACFVLVLRIVPSPVYGRVGSLQLVLETLTRKGNLALAALFACYVAQWTSVMIWLPTFAAEERGASAALAALLTALMVLANVPGNLTGAWLLTRGVRRGPLVIAASAIAALCELAMFSALLPDALRFGAVLAFSFCAGVIPASIFAGLPMHAKSAQHIATGNGMAMQASQAGQFFAPVLIAWIATRFGGWDAALWAMLALAAGAAACGAALLRIERRLAT
jgi:MFS family permease